jgi:hypothetical protein
MNSSLSALALLLKPPFLFGIVWSVQLIFLL